MGDSLIFASEYGNGRVFDLRLLRSKIPEHALHEKGLQRQIGVGTLVSSQERRALFVPRIYRGLTAGFVPPSVFPDMPCMKRVYKDK